MSGTSHEETVSQAVAAIVANYIPAHSDVDVEGMVEAIACEVVVWVAESYNEGLTDARQRMAP